MRSMQQMVPYQRSVKVTSAWKGYNHNDIIADGEIYDMKNMSGDRYPLFTTRRKRCISSFDVQGEESVPLNGLHGRDALVMIRGTDVYYNFEPVTGISVSTSEAMLPKQIVSMGAYVLIFPDKVYFNTADQNDHGSMERHWPPDGVTGADVSVAICRQDGSIYGETTRSNDPPANPSRGQLWIDSSGIKDVLLQWDESTEEWVEIGTVFVKISATGIGSGLKEYDALTISGLEADDEITDEKIRQQVDDLNGSKVVYACGDNWIVVVGMMSLAQAALEDEEIHVDRTIPDMDFIVESNNRLWGCKYGLANDQVVNEIYASVLGDFRNWGRILGISTDSYTASVGTDGPFTGATKQRGYPVFFKDNAIHKVTGNMPSNFGIQTTIARGVQRGSWRSLAVVAENIYYKSSAGIMVYDGNMPVPVSEQLGSQQFTDARAGVLNDKYYISMMDSSDAWHLFVYDTKHEQWWREDNTQALAFGAADNDLYFIDEANNTLVSVMGLTGNAEQDFDWFAEFDLFGTTYQGYYDDPKRVRNAKYISLFKIRARLAQGANLKLYIKYDNNNYVEAGQKTGTDLRTFVLPVVPKRCDHIRFKVTGHGDAEIYDISRILEVGGDG